MRILVTESADYCPQALSLYRGAGEVECRTLTRGELLAGIEAVNVLVVRLGISLDRELLEKARELKFIVTPTTGLTHIDLDFAQDMGVRIVSLKGETDFLSKIPATAEHSWALLLAVQRRIVCAHESVARGNSWDRDSFQGELLSGKTLGIMGYGRLGKIVGRYGKAFGMRVLAFDSDENAYDSEIEVVNLERLFSESDIVSVHVSYTSENRSAIDRRLLQRAKHGMILINTSRGEVIDEEALLQALESGQLKAAGLDVLADEGGKEAQWIEGHPLVEYARQHDNLVITPHLGGAVPEAMRATERHTAELFLKALEKQ